MYDGGDWVRVLSRSSESRRRAATAIIASMMLLQCNIAAAEALTPAALAAIDSAAGGFISSGYAPGVSVAVMRDGHLLLAKGYGREDLETDTPTTPETVFRAGSITKMFTAAAILRLAEGGRLSIDDPVAKYVPELAGVGHLTLRMLLTQTSGLHDYTESSGFGVAHLEHHTQKQMIDFIASMKPLMDFVPGSRWAYSNSNYFVLGAIVERVSGKTLGQYLAANIIAPAGAISTAVDNERDVVSHRSSGYELDENGPGHYENASFFTLSTAGGAGALRSTALDLARWHQALFAGRIINRDSLALMTAPARLNSGAVAVRKDAPITLGPPNYGFGLELGKLDGERAVGHGGSVPGFTAYLVTFPSLSMTVSIMTNGEPRGAGIEYFRSIERAALHGIRK